MLKIKKVNVILKQSYVYIKTNIEKHFQELSPLAEVCHYQQSKHSSSENVKRC